jgi:amino acid transporter
MKKNLSVLGLMWISLTSMIGSGWLFGSLYSAHYAGPAAVIAWPLAGILLLFVALSYAEVGTMFPQTNSLVRLPLLTHGRLASVIISGLVWISLVTIPVIETQGLLQYASNYLPNLMIQNGVRYSCTIQGHLLALVLLSSFVLLNIFGIRLFARINAAFTIWKLLIPSITIICLLTFSYHPQNFSEYGGFMPYGWQGIMAAMSSGGVLFSLLGFTQVIIMMNQIEDPGKYVPVVLITSLAFTALLYTGLQWAFIGSLQQVDLTHGWMNLNFVGDAGPFAALAAIAGLIWLSTLLYSDAFISPYSTALVYSTTAAKILADMGTTHDAPQSLAKENKYQAPWFSLIVNFLLAAMMLYLLENWQAMAAFLVATMMASYAIGPICLICLRKLLPNYNRPFRLRSAGIIAFIGFYVCTAGVYWAGYKSVLKLFIITLIGLCAYIIYFIKQKKLIAALNIKNSVWIILHLSGITIFSYYGNYEGKKIIPLYWDLAYLMLFSLAFL